MWNDGGLRANPREGTKPLPSPRREWQGAQKMLKRSRPRSRHFFGHRERHHVAGIVADLAGIEIGVFVQLSAGDGAFDRGTGGALVGEEVAAGERILARLDVHVDAAGGGEGDRWPRWRSPRKPLTTKGTKVHEGNALSSFARPDSRGRLSPHGQLSPHEFWRRCGI